MNTHHSLPKDVLLQGIRLLKTVMKGDSSALLPYSDWVCEHGMPGFYYVLPPDGDIVKEKIEWLRNPKCRDVKDVRLITDNELISTKSVLGMPRGLHAAFDNIGWVHVYGTYDREPFPFTSMWIGSFPIELWEERLSKTNEH